MRQLLGRNRYGWRRQQMVRDPENLQWLEPVTLLRAYWTRRGHRAQANLQQGREGQREGQISCQTWSTKKRERSGNSTQSPPSCPLVSYKHLYWPNPMGKQWTVWSPGNSILGQSSLVRMENGGAEQIENSHQTQQAHLFDTSLRNLHIWGEMCTERPVPRSSL